MQYISLILKVSRPHILKSLCNLRLGLRYALNTDFKVRRNKRDMCKNLWKRIKNRTFNWCKNIFLCKFLLSNIFKIIWLLMQINKVENRNIRRYFHKLRYLSNIPISSEKFYGGSKCFIQSNFCKTKIRWTFGFLFCQYERRVQKYLSWHFCLLDICQ